MRPGGTPKGYGAQRFLPNSCRMAIRPANRKSRRPIATVTPVTDQCGQILGRMILAAWVKNGQRRAGWYRPQKPYAFIIGPFSTGG